MSCACLLDRATRGVERRRTLQVGGGVFVSTGDCCAGAKIPASVGPSRLFFSSALAHQALASTCSAKAGSCNRWHRRFPVELRKLQIRIAPRGEPQVVHAMGRRQLLISRCRPKHRSEFYFLPACASIFSITNALDPPRSYTFPLATTLSPANGRSFAFCPLDGVVSAIGQ
jgi:hypothetical protein